MSRARVLVVDDIPDTADSLTALLSIYGFECESQLGGVSALKSVRRQPPDIVLLDLRMPQMDGFEVLRRLRDVEGCEQIPVVMISGYNIAESRARELGVAQFFTKPVDLRQLLDTMEELLENHAEVQYSLVAAV
jgi:CheY-like chemotaxis protein